jgi:uncharacterized protein (TIGR02145 family)
MIRFKLPLTMKTKLAIQTGFMMMIFQFIGSSAFSQFPDKMSYQAVIRNHAGELVTDHSVGIRIQIKQGNQFGGAVYVETHEAETDANGLVSLEIGGGTIVLGSFGSIDWANGPYFLQTETDPEGGTNYSISGVSPLLSVPFAQYAKHVAGFSGSYNELTDKPDFSKMDKDSTDNVTLTGNQTISGIKRFSGTISAGDSPITNVGEPHYATDAANKAYVDEVMSQLNTLKNTVIAGGIATDMEGNRYNTVSIGLQVWMAENLKTTHYRNGDSIPNIIKGSLWCSLSSGAWCNYENISRFGETYGKMYNFFAVTDLRGLCPSGWHVPSINEWIQMVDYLGGEDVAGGKLKEAGFEHWLTPNEGATNESGFTALPGGRRDCESVYIGYLGTWWSATQEDQYNARGFTIQQGSAGAMKDNGMKQEGSYVRCVKDPE